MNTGPKTIIKTKSRNLIFWCSCIILMVVSACSNIEKPNEYVDVFIGTGGHGHTYPGATVPFGMIQPGPVNGTAGWDWVSGYHYSDSVITGFAQTHLSGTGIGDLNDILIQPVSGEISLDAPQKYDGKRFYASRISHELEEATPGYYSVLLQDYGIVAEMTANERVAMYRFTYPEEKNHSIILDLGFSLNWDRTDSAKIEVVDEYMISGYRMSSGWAADQKVYFAIEFSEPFEVNSVLEDSVFSEIKTYWEGEQLSTRLDFFSEEGTVLAKIAISGVSEDGAILNLETQKEWDFDKMRSDAAQTWQNELETITVEGSSDEKTKFYTALYHTKMAPALFSDVDGAYRGGDGEVYTQPGSNRYTIFSLWDTFRAQHPLLTITNPERVDDFINTMLGFYEETGFLPVWELHGNETNTMTGYHAIPVILDAFQKGFRGFDAELAFEAMKASAMQEQRSSDVYREYGYIPTDLGVESVTKTLEYAYDDWCIAQMAKLLGKDEEHDYFIERADFWKNVYDGETKFMRGKNQEGDWAEPFDPLRSTHRHSTVYTEGNAWQHSWFVPHDVSALVDSIGGDEAFTTRLDSMFQMPSLLTGEDISPDISGMLGQYAHGNEPSHHIAYLYNYAGTPWKTQHRVRQIMDSLYTTQPDGLSGNEDAGQMSAWFVFSAMGLYPVNPANSIYVIGSPVLEESEIKLQGEKTFTIKAINLSIENLYIQTATLNGNSLERSYITHSELMKGGSLTFEMGDQPNKNWAVNPELRPPNIITYE